MFDYFSLDEEEDRIQQPKGKMSSRTQINPLLIKTLLGPITQIKIQLLSLVKGGSLIGFLQPPQFKLNFH